MTYEIIIGALASILFLLLCAFTIHNIWKEHKDGK